MQIYRECPVKMEAVTGVIYLQAKGMTRTTKARRGNCRVFHRVLAGSTAPVDTLILNFWPLEL